MCHADYADSADLYKKIMVVWSFGGLVVWWFGRLVVWSFGGLGW